MLTKIHASLLIAACLMIGGCGTNERQGPGGAGSGTAEPVAEKSGAQLWAENCSRCHNIRSPQSFSDAQWQTITHHMRLRADLTGQETRKITEFLKASD